MATVLRSPKMEPPMSPVGTFESLLNMVYLELDVPKKYCCGFNTRSERLEEMAWTSLNNKNFDEKTRERNENCRAMSLNPSRAK